eukprot:1405338-Pyramimonas_sp.AAC.3
MFDGVDAALRQDHPPAQRTVPLKEIPAAARTNLMVYPSRHHWICDARVQPSCVRARSIASPRLEDPNQCLLYSVNAPIVDRTVGLAPLSVSRMRI